MIALLILLFANLYVTEGTECPQLGESLKNQITYFAKKNEGWNVTVDCKLVEEAALLAHRILLGKSLTVSTTWCVYKGLSCMMLCLYVKPALQIEKTAKLHQPTTYGCAYLFDQRFLSKYWATVCLYKMKKGVNECK
ncbi:unnamed protein product [Nippostrongylus brasiliensis]|uniref:RNAse_Pc domain-containing protein n=1 Tax=Nippostrongylus brasiliensis TaxID=27835 RepID=A0A0N4YG46_NIPBR|nr:unnamed protein product [Nippostrongylus brasiliensis]